MRTMKKRLLAIAMIPVLTIPLMIGCVGCGNNPEKNLGGISAKSKNGVIDCPQAGVKCTLPDSLKDQQDKIGASGYVDSSWLAVNYYMIDEKDSENVDRVLAQVIAYREKFSNEELLGDTPTVSEDVLMDLGYNGTFYYSAFRFDQAYAEDPSLLSECFEGLDETGKAQYLDLLSHSTELINGIEISPVNVPDPPKITELDPAKTMSYVLQDIDGNDVKLGDVIAANKVTMLNFWGVGCGPCVGEMPGLESLYQDYKDQSFGIVGITTDIVMPNGSVSDDAIDEAKSIREDTGVTYPLVIASSEVLQDAQITATPTTYFVDSNGNILGSVIGSRSEGYWGDMLEEYLQKMQ